MKKINLKPILTICLVVLLSSCGNKQENQQAPPRPPATFPVAQIKPKTITGYQEYPTNIEGIINSNVRAKVSGYIQKVFVDEGGNPGFVESVMPREMSIEDIKAVVEEYRVAARNDVDAGFDGIELHSANGYLLNPFIDSQSNTRNDEYGGSVQKRIRFLKEEVKAVSEEIGADKVGVRLAPLTTLNGTVDDNPEETYLAIASMLNSFKVGYMHIAEADWDDAPQMPISFKMAIREAYSGLLIYAGKYDTERAEQALTEGWADMIGFGRPFVANPDLPYRLANNVPLNEHNPDTLFGGGEKGYTDYSFAK